MQLAHLDRVAAGTPGVLLLSGGVDSTTLLALATKAGYAVHALTFRYGQRHGIEIERARAIAARYKVARHVVADIDLRLFGGSALTADIAVPKDRAEAAMSEGIPVTYVPARNTIFLSFALAWAEVAQASDLLIGVNALDYSGYPDCRPDYIRAFEKLANLATKAGVEGTKKFRVLTPLIDLTKAAIIQTGAALGVRYGETISCYDPSPAGDRCGHCDSCLIRARGFAEAGVPD
jgi:7-cyano-7-deazaguanine synthase